MQLTGLKSIQNSMRENNMNGGRFEFKYKNAHFKCLFYTDESPYILILAIQGTSFAMKVDVNPGYNIIPFINPKSKYYELIELLGLESSDEKFSPKAFFETVNAKLPQTVTLSDRPYTYEKAPYIDIAEEKDKVYFYKWQPHNNGKSGVTPENLEKTRDLISHEFYEICKRKNISSQWTDKEKYKHRIPSRPE